jgi:hypothetical protein
MNGLNKVCTSKKNALIECLREYFGKKTEKREISEFGLRRHLFSRSLPFLCVAGLRLWNSDSRV